MNNKTSGLILILTFVLCVAFPSAYRGQEGKQNKRRPAGKTAAERPDGEENQERIEGALKRVGLGVKWGNFANNPAYPSVLIVTSVKKGSASDDAELMVDDVIEKVNDVRVRGISDLTEQINQPAGVELQLTVSRNDDEMDLVLKLP